MTANTRLTRGGYKDLWVWAAGSGRKDLGLGLQGPARRTWVYTEAAAGHTLTTLTTSTPNPHVSDEVQPAGIAVPTRPPNTHITHITQ